MVWKVSEASKREVALAMKRHGEQFDKAVAECQHKRRVVIEYPPVDWHGIALDGGKVERCAFHHCNKLMKVLA